jgi:hypothetical protein
MAIYTCTHCGKEFDSPHSRKTCSDACYCAVQAENSAITKVNRGSAKLPRAYEFRRCLCGSLFGYHPKPAPDVEMHPELCRECWKGKGSFVTDAPGRRVRL